MCVCFMTVREKLRVKWEEQRTKKEIEKWIKEFNHPLLDNLKKILEFVKFFEKQTNKTKLYHMKNAISSNKKTESQNS